MTDPMGNVYTYSYDDNGNRIKTTYSDGSSVSSVYDARGRVTSQTDQHGYKTKYAYDGGDRLTGVTDALGNVTRYTYDEVGNLTSVTDANGNVTRYSYDDFGRVIKTTNALGNSTYTTYDESGTVLTSTDFGGNLTTYTYDDLDRVSSKTTPDGTVSYTYTVDGKISTVTDSTGTTTFTYNSMDGLTRVDYPDGNYVSYKYDKSNRLTKVSTAFGDTAYQYDTLDRITRVVDRNGYATVYEYDANGNRTAVKYANGLTVSYEYDKLNRLNSEETIDNDSNIVVKYVYTLGASGERLSVTELDRTVEYTYDELYRLTSETITKGKTKTTYTYAYDSVSNRTLKNVDGDETVYTYNSLNQLVSENDTTYEYDNAGNLVCVVGVGKTAIYSYNSENKLIKATVQQGNNVVVETYTYDYAGNRTSKTTTINNHVEKVYYLNDNSSLTNVLVEYSANGDEICYYTIGADLVSQEINGKVYVYLYDGHGTVRALANESGKLTDKYCYDAFGNLISSTGSTANSYRYCGEQFDSTTGLYYLRARYMDTSTGRFISQDSYAGSISAPVSLHKYLYANSNPVMYTDPSGYLAVEGNFALALAGDEYAMNRLAIQMTTSEMGYYSRDAKSVGRHISNVVAVGLAIIAALTAVIIDVSDAFEQIDEISVAFADGSSTSAGANPEYRDEKCNEILDAQRNYRSTNEKSGDLIFSINGNRFNVNDIDGWQRDNNISNVYPSIKESPNYPKGFIAARNGTTKNNVNNLELLNNLRQVEAGRWYKVYKDGFDMYGNKVSIHYFQSPSGKVFNVKVKNGWSNKTSSSY